MPVLREQIKTSLPIGEAFAFVADFANSMHWDPGVASSKRIGEGSVGRGSRFALEVRMGAGVTPMEYEITTFEPPHRVVLKGTGARVTAVDEIAFRAAADGTHVDYRADIRLRGVLRLAEPFLGGTFAKIGRDALAGMRAALDERVASAGGAL